MDSGQDPASMALPAPASLAGLYLAHLLDTGADHAIMPTRCASELARLGWLASFDQLATVPSFGWGFLVARSLIAVKYPGADETDLGTGRQCCVMLDGFIDEVFLAAEG